MQITNVEVTPVDLHLRVPYRTAYQPDASVDRVSAVFVRIDTRQGDVAWGCAAFDPAITGETLAEVTAACERCADRAKDLNPLNMAYAMVELEPLAQGTPSALCAFDIALYDLLGIATGLPLHRLLGGYRSKIQTSITVRLAPVDETVARAQARAQQGFRILKIKGGLNAEEDVRRIRAVCDALPNITVRLDADGGYTVAEAIAVARALQGRLEMLEQPVAPEAGIEAMRQVKAQSQVPILADQSAVGAASVLDLAHHHAVDGVSIKLATSGGLHAARQVEAIARAGHLATMVGCVHEPALLIAAELALALSSPSVKYGDLDGHIDLEDDPTGTGFQIEDGWLIATDAPGLGCHVEL